MSTKTILPLVVGLLLAAPLAAQETESECPNRPAKLGRAKNKARKWFDKGEKLSKEARLEDSLDAFLCSQKMKGHENTVFNIAQISKLIENKRLTLKRLRQFREQNPNVESAAEIDKLIIELEEELGEEPPEPVVDESLFAEDKPEPEPEEPAQSKIDRRTVSYILLGGAGATLVISTALQGAAGANKNKAADATNWNQFDYRRDRMKGLQVGALIGFITTGVLAGVGLYLLLTDDRETESDGENEVTLALVPAPAGIVLKGSF